MLTRAFPPPSACLEVADTIIGAREFRQAPTQALMGGCDGTRPRVCHPRWSFDLSTPDCQTISKKSHTVAPRCTWRHRYDRSNVRVLSETSNLDYLHDAGRTSMEVCDDKALRAGICSCLPDSLVNC